MSKSATMLVGVLFLAAVMYGCGGGHSSDTSSGGDTQHVRASTGDNGSVSTGSTVTLDGSDSSSASGQPLTYNWAFTSKPSGSNATIFTPNAPTATFIADVDGTYTVSLTVSDNSGNKDVANVTFTAGSGNLPPTASAGADQTVAVGATVTLNGGGSSDPNGDRITYAWSLVTSPTGSASSLASPSSITCTFVPDVPGDYKVQLIVNDGKINSLPTQMTVHASSQPVNRYMITAVSANDACKNTGTNGPTRFFDTSTAIPGYAAEMWYYNTLSRTTEYAVAYDYALLELGLGQISADQTVQKAVLHVYVGKVIQTFNSDPTLAQLLHLRGTGYTGNALYDFTHANTTSMDAIYTYPSDTKIGWQTYDVTSLVQADIAAGSAWSIYFLQPTRWMDTVDKQKSKGVSIGSADAGPEYAAYLEIETAAK